LKGKSARSRRSREEGPRSLYHYSGERLLLIGELTGTHGVRGEARLRPFNRDSEVLASVTDVFIVGFGGEVTKMTLENARPHGTVWLVALGDVSTPEAARRLARSRVAIRERDLPRLEAGQFYCYQLIGLDVVDGSGQRVGQVADVLATAANDVLVVRDGAVERLIPMVDHMVADVDLDAARIVVTPVAGLFES
jgi:16S rRNA processing protein RimM